MCFPSTPSAPPPAPDPAIERANAEAAATTEANARIAADRARRQRQSVFATGAAGVDVSSPVSSVMAYGKQRLGE